MVAPPSPQTQKADKLPDTPKFSHLTQPNASKNTLRNDGSLYLGEDPITPEQLVDQLKVQSQNDPNHRIFVRADAHIDYGRVMQVMGQITSGGFTHVALLAQQPQSGQ